MTVISYPSLSAWMPLCEVTLSKSLRMLPREALPVRLTLPGSVLTCMPVEASPMHSNEMPVCSDSKSKSATREKTALLPPAFCSRVVHTLPKICAQNPGAGLNLWIYYKGLLHFSINHLLNIIFYRIRIIESEMEIFFVRGTINHFH